MCSDCAFWQIDLVFAEHGVRYAPCALRPDRLTRDRRTTAGFVEQAYRCSEHYHCFRFTPSERFPNVNLLP